MTKSRRPKGYRQPTLDETLRNARTRTEARLFREARTRGVPVPILYDVDLVEARLTMEFVDGPTVKEVLTRKSEGLRSLCRQIGTLVAALHTGDLVHGDLTTSNLILREGGLVLVDFGLAEKGGDVEAKGVDLHLLREAFLSAHADQAELFEEVLSGYRKGYAEADVVIAKAEDIQRRRRYHRGS